MTQTIGYWCDTCRAKYVRHKCKVGLPCGHEKSQAIFVYAKHYGRTGGESVELGCGDWTARVWLTRKQIERHAGYGSEFSFEIWGQRVIINRGDDISEDDSMDVGCWLQTLTEPQIRAFLNRWDSQDEPPGWRKITHMRQSAERLGFPAYHPSEHWRLLKVMHLADDSRSYPITISYSCGKCVEAATLTLDEKPPLAFGDVLRLDHNGRSLGCDAPPWDLHITEVSYVTLEVDGAVPRTDSV